jgi:carbamoyltransferase
LLANNKIIGWFQGRMEIGPRALGNRSILANPKPKNMWKKINKLKEREMWRPLAPSIIQEHINDYLDDAKLSPFMLKSFQVNKNKRLIIPAVVHIDHSTRPQTVSQKTNKKLWGLINEFYKITNIPLILNTSFNDRNEPIVCSPSDAIKTFFSTPLDYLVLENCLIEK